MRDIFLCCSLRLFAKNDKVISVFFLILVLCDSWENGYTVIVLFQNGLLLLFQKALSFVSLVKVRNNLKLNIPSF